MKININDKSLLDYFEAFDKEMLKKIYDDATSVEKIKKSLKAEAAKN